MPRSEDVEYRWETVKGSMWPAYTLKRFVGGKRKGDLVESWKGELNVLQDMDNTRWLYGIKMERKIRLGKDGEKVAVSGHAASLPQAKVEAEKLLELLSPKKMVVEADAFG